ncbi:sulfatase-like hydrolase/transferase [Halostella litorea]|uniref:sulfatase-like hydrolase/transferase n=1 Tax=Halostella litorea TaxID=2528831 RepID=UPI00109325C3|nr:sulfatase-like hydrolase/transferase [Halostella litorea]
MPADTQRDVVLVTVDCWRHDAPARMPNLAALTEGYDRRDAICQAPATRGAFPALLSSKYYPQAYAGFDEVRRDVESLPEVLSAAGYETCGIVGSNPFLSTWGGDFDRFWNDRMDADADDEGVRGTLRAGASRLRHAYNYLRLRSRVPASEVASRGREWYESRSGPRFLWMHLMDVHVPFFPGLRKGMSEGLVDGYRSHLRFMRDPDSLSAEEYDALERFYWRSVERLDEQIDEVLGFLDDDALVVITGDHGEEFDHGGYGHARPYDECIRVPLLSSPGLAASFGDRETLRHLDVPATIVDAVGCAVPDSWEGAPGDRADPFPAFTLNHSPQFGRTYGAVRTERYKLFKAFDDDTDELVGAEAYDLRDDPGETRNLYGQDPPATVRTLESRLDGFLDREDIRSGIHEDPRNAPEVVEDRLQALGYK